MVFRFLEGRKCNRDFSNSTRTRPTGQSLFNGRERIRPVSWQLRRESAMVWGAASQPVKSSTLSVAKKHAMGFFLLRRKCQRQRKSQEHVDHGLSDQISCRVHIWRLDFAGARTYAVTHGRQASIAPTS